MNSRPNQYPLDFSRNAVSIVRVRQPYQTDQDGGQPKKAMYEGTHRHGGSSSLGSARRTTRYVLKAHTPRIASSSPTSGAAHAPIPPPSGSAGAILRKASTAALFAIILRQTKPVPQHNTTATAPTVRLVTVR